MTSNRNTHSTLVHPVEVTDVQKKIVGEGKVIKVTKRESLTEELQRVCDETQFDLAKEE